MPISGRGWRLTSSRNDLPQVSATAIRWVPRASPRPWRLIKGRARVYQVHVGLG
jgi:hypothetical protein